MRPRVKTLLGVTLALVVLLLLGGGWLGREPVLSWYYLRGLKQANETDRDSWADRVAGLKEAPVAGLVEGLRTEEDRRCENVTAALTRLVQRWPPNDPRQAALAHQLTTGFAGFSEAGQRQVLLLAVAWVKEEGEKAPSPEVAHMLAHLLPASAALPAHRGAALELATLLLLRPDGAEMVAPCRELARVSLQDENAVNREFAAQIALHPGMNLQQELLPALRDPSPEVRRLAIAALGPAEDVITTDDLLRWLHDPDLEVRQLCETALRGRKLSTNHIRLGRLLTHDKPEVRLQVLDHLYRAPDLDPGVWLRYLSHDPVPSVRAAALRAAALEYPEAGFGDRIEQMRTDPSPTVGQLAHYYLKLRRERRTER